MLPLRTGRLLAFARELQRASTFQELLEFAMAEAREAAGYDHVWLGVAESEDATELKMVSLTGFDAKRAELVWEHAATIPITGDRMMEEIMRGDAPVVVEDALTDPRTNKAIVQELRNRTIINIPLRLLDRPFGTFGLGTFGDEGVRVPTAEQLDYLVGMASQLSVAAGRIRFQEVQRHAAKEKRGLERRLAQAQRLESLGLLAGGVAHDFNNLLTVVLATVELAQRPGLDPEVAGALTTIMEAASRGAQLTQQLLAVGRAQPLDLMNVDVNQRIRGLITLLQRVFPATITMVHHARSSAALVTGDPSQLDQLLMNLCINARDAMPHGGRVTLETENVTLNGSSTGLQPWARSGDYLLVMVTDTGVGMTPDVAERVFEPFFTTKGEKRGTGLGLAVAYGIVRQHGGYIHCYSEVGVGTTFKIHLPLKTLPEVVVRPQRDVPATGGSEHILLAEDDPAIRATIQRVLDRAGYRVHVVATGDAACAAVDRERFDLVILDVVMPGKSCRDTLAQVRTRRPEIRVLLTSGYSAETNVAELVRDAGCEFLRKPYDIDGLLRAIRRALEA